jgi:hypothetical protein
VHGDDVRVSKAGDREGLLFESTDRQRDSGAGAEDHLDRYLPLQDDLSPPVDGAHAPGAESRVYPVLPIKSLSDKRISLHEQSAVAWAHFGGTFEVRRADRAKGQDRYPVLLCIRQSAFAQRI